MYEYGEMMKLEELFEGMMGLNLLSNLWSTLISIVSYVLMAVGMYTIAKRRGIHNPWLAWIPFGSSWMLGCISDQYRYVAKGEEKSKRKILLGLEIGVSVIGVAVFGLIIAALMNFTFGCDFDAPQQWEWSRSASLAMGALGLCFVMLGLGIAYLVVSIMALHDLFASCTPENATVFTVLSIFLGGLLRSIFVFASRNKEQGMPPRHQQMYSEQPVWQPPQPPVEPWELNNEE